jgi:hypothetical protein
MSFGHERKLHALVTLLSTSAKRMNAQRSNELETAIRSFPQAFPQKMWKRARHSRRSPAHRAGLE